MAEDSTSDDKRSSSDLRGLLRQLVTPVIEQVETRVSTQIDAEVAERIDELLSTRMATIDRAIGGIDRHLSELSARLDRLERHLGRALEAPTEDVAEPDAGDEPEA